MKISVLSIILASSFFIGCHVPLDKTSKSSSTADWNKRTWLDKAARTLLYHSPSLSREEENRLLAMNEEEAIDELMKKPEFYDTVLDFNMYFAGVKHETLKSDFSNEYMFNFNVSQSAVNAARELADNGDYFTLFDWQMPKIIVRLLDQDRPDSFLEKLSALNLETFDSAFQLSIKSSLACGALGDPVIDSAPLRSALEQDLAGLESLVTKLPDIIKQLPPADAKITKITDFAKIDPSVLGPLKSRALESFSLEMWASLPNSSTNMNRRRAAYMLKTYFCDDLTPLNIVAPSSHTGNKHASDSGCAACHYKLDPMAAFFRNRGATGIEFKEEDGVFLHDDLLRRRGDEYTQYLSNWLAPEGSHRKWNAAYIRSANRESLNSYGESLDDLFHIIRGARETKVCLTKRMAEYVLGPTQVYDGGWINALAENFQKAAASDAPPGASSVAFKQVMKSLVLSKSFSTRDPELGQCYDFAPGAKASSLPCAVASIIERNCSVCHKGEGAPAGLDLSSWTQQSDGHLSFTHHDLATGLSFSKAETLSRMKDRLTSSDPKRQMPFMQQMDPVDRANLFKWIESELAEAK
ncbi:MAG: hypothetical protein NTX25_04340 [Proteobacteria bacterium]|nr:hypothetical protein [Pseudomonadota bacterium]